MVDRHDLNLFEFFRDVALRFQQEHLGIQRMSQARHDHLHEVLYELEKAYFNHAAIEYDDPDRMIAYTMHFAAKHAVVWRTLARKFSVEEDESVDWTLNSIGTGPGSEIFGMLCGLPGVEDLNVFFVGLERELAWRELFEIAREEFILRTGVDLTGFVTNDSANLRRNGQTIGSFVLSDAARRSEAGQLLQDIRDLTDGDEAWFLGFDIYPTGPGTTEFVNAPLKRAGFRANFTQLKAEKEYPDAVRAEMDGCDPLFCKRQIKDQLPLTFYRVRLR